MTRRCPEVDLLSLAAPPRSTPALQGAYLRALAQHGRIGRAAAAAGINRRQPRFWRLEDPDFKHAERIVLDRIEVDREMARLAAEEEVGDAA